MPKGAAKSTSTLVAWWLSDGDEECPHCGQLYVYELEFRCPDCDGAVCPHCKKRHTKGHHVCPDCFETSDGTATSERRTHG